MRQLIFISVATLWTVLSTSALAEREWPEKVYDCHVTTISGAYGLVSIQTFSLDAALQGVKGQTAKTMADLEGTAERAVQCVEQRSGKRFTDSSFQAWVETLEG
ncbi:MAG: hypothetical protein AAGI44_00945 [Pseudomonadota bacterium]